jgi:hypothetical protein
MAMMPGQSVVKDPMRPDTLGLAIPVLAHSEIVLRHSPGLHLCPPDPLLQTLDWTLSSARPIAGCLADRLYRREE